MRSVRGAADEDTINVWTMLGDENGHTQVEIDFVAGRWRDDDVPTTCVLLAQ